MGHTLTLRPCCLIGFVSLAAVLMTSVARAHDPITTRVTWTVEISRILEARCVSCHSPGGRAPMSLASYAEARPWAKAIKEEVQTRRMPKWHAVRGYGEFADDPSLSPFEIALITAWADGGAPLGRAPDKATGVSGHDAALERAPSAASPGRDVRETIIACGDQPLPEGVLLAVAPALERGGSVGISVALPDGRREIVAWIRNYDPEFAGTYRLRTPLDLPAGSRSHAEYDPPPGRQPPAPGSDGRCSVRVIVGARR